MYRIRRKTSLGVHYFKPINIDPELWSKITVYTSYILLSLAVFFVPLGNGDEIWNYQFAKNIAEGLMPYRDFNIIQTPLSAYLAAPFLLLFGKGLFSFRIAAFILSFGIAYESYRVSYKISKAQGISFITTLVVLMINAPYFIYNYNYLCALLLLVVMDLECNTVDSRWRNIAIGTIVGMLPLVKQTIGAFALVGNFIVCAINIWKYNKDKIGQALRIFSSGVPLLIYTVFLFTTQSFDDFWEYAISGIRSFTHKYDYIQLISDNPSFILISLLFIPGVVALIKAWIRENTIEPVQVSGLVFLVAWGVVAYPLCDPSHFAALFYLVMPVTHLFIDCEKLESGGKRAFLVVGAVLCVFVFVLRLPIKNDITFSSLYNYECIPIKKNVEKSIYLTTEYIREKEKEGYDVKIVNMSATGYYIPMDKYAKDWSMLLVGNIGERTIEELLEEDKPRLYLIAPTGNTFIDQNHNELITYIKENFDKVDTLGNWEVYSR